MKIRGITLRNVRRFTGTARVEGIGDGLNVLSEPNEHGKSTLFDAIQALFFKPHGSKDKDIAALRPHAGGAPEVAVDVETSDGVFRVTKRWLQKPLATVHRGDVLVAQSDAAEAWIADLLGTGTGGPSGLIWVRQGVTDLSGGSTKEKQAALEARRDLMTAVGHEVEAMTGGRRMDMALARCRAELGELATGTGRPKANGPWKAAQDAVEALQAEHDELYATARDLHAALAERKRARRALGDLDTPEAVQARKDGLDRARAAHAAALRHADLLETEARKVAMARLTVDSTTRRLTELRAATAEFETASGSVAKAEIEVAQSRARHDAALGQRDAAQTALAEAENALEQAEALRLAAAKAQAARDGASRRADLETRIAQADATRRDMETAAAAAGTGPDATALRQIEDIASALNAARAARDATATQVIVHYAPGQAGQVRAGEDVLRDGEPLALTRATRLTLSGLGTLDLRPGDAQPTDQKVDTARARLRDALARLGADSVEAARDMAAARNAAERRMSEARAVLASLAPDGIEALRTALEAIPVAQDQPDLPSLADAEALQSEARARRDAARIARDSANDSLAEARDAATRADTALGQLRDRLARAKDSLAKCGDATEPALIDELDQHTRHLETAEAAHADKLRDAPDLAATAAALARAESVDNRAREEIADLGQMLARLEERIDRSAGDAVEERLADTAERLAAARADLARIEHEVAVLRRLEQALELARNAARDRYFAPIAQELRPLLQLLWPGADLTWGEETLLPDTLIRDGRPEPIDILSGGTQEQIALLVRLAFARMLATSGRVAPVILDDALVYTDDDRIERMFDALHRQAGNQQIIVLSCRQRAFRDLGGHALRLVDLPDGGA